MFLGAYIDTHFEFDLKKKPILLILGVVIQMINMSGAQTDYSALNQEVFDSQNVARTNPSYFATLADDDIENKFVYDESGNPTTYICLNDDFVAKSTTGSYKLTTTAGVAAWEEMRDYMNAFSTSLVSLTWSDNLAQAGYDHISDTGPQGMTGHTGSDGSSPFDRMDRYATYGAAGENIAYGNEETGDDVIKQFLIDDGVASRGHRSNIMSASYTHTGISGGCHTTYSDMGCIAYAGSLVETVVVTLEVAPRLDTGVAYADDPNGGDGGDGGDGDEQTSFSFSLSGNQAFVLTIGLILSLYLLI